MRKFTKFVSLALMGTMILCAGCGQTEKAGTTDSAQETSVENSKTNEKATENEEASEDTSGASAASADAFSGDWNEKEATGYSPFFLKYGLQGVDVKNTDDVQMYGLFTLGQCEDLKSILSNFNYFVAKDIYVSRKYSSADELINDESLFRGDQFMDEENNKIGEDVDICCYLDDPDEGGKLIITLNVVNTTGVHTDMKTLIATNSFRSEANMGFDHDSSISKSFQIGTGDNDEFRADLAQVIDLMGKPDKIYKGMNTCMNTDRYDKNSDEKEAFEDTVANGGGMINYVLVYEKDNYNVEMTIVETNYHDKYKGDFEIVFTSKDIPTIASKHYEDSNLYMQ